jgi:hypothetical protein
MPGMQKQPKPRPPRGSSTGGQPKARGTGSKGGKKTSSLTNPKGYRKGY